MFDRAPIEQNILEKLAQGHSLRSICMDDGIPNRATIMRWLDDDAEFATKYVRAKEIGLDEKADKLAEDLDDEPDVSRAKLKFEYARWYLSKLAPKKYGDKIQHTDADGTGPVAITQKIEMVGVRPTS